MAGQVFAYIRHKEGKADDTAPELVIAAGKIDPAASPTAIVAGAGSDLDAVCTEMAASYKEVWKFDIPALANALTIVRVPGAAFFDDTRIHAHV